MVSCPSFSTRVIRAINCSIRLIETASLKTHMFAETGQNREPGNLIGMRPMPRFGAETMDAAALATLPDEPLLEIVQRQTFHFFWDGAHPVSGLAPDRCTTRANAADDKVAIGGSGFGIMAILVAVERGWVTREAAIERLSRMLDLLTAATCYHGAYAHFVNGRNGATIPFYRKDDGGDLVETA